MDPLHGRSVVLYDPFPLWLDAVEKAVTSGGLTIQGKATDFGVARTLIDECEPDILVAENIDAETESEELTMEPRT